MTSKEPEHSTVFNIPGDELVASLEKRAARHQGELNDCLESVSTILKEHSGESYETLLQTCVQAMLAMNQPTNMTVWARVINAQMERAAFLQNERTDLLTIARNVRKDRSYRITVEEARRYGMT